MWRFRKKVSRGGSQVSRLSNQMPSDVSPTRGDEEEELDATPGVRYWLLSIGWLLNECQTVSSHMGLLGLRCQ